MRLSTPFLAFPRNKTRGQGQTMRSQRFRLLPSPAILAGEGQDGGLEILQLVQRFPTGRIDATRGDSAPDRKGSLRAEDSRIRRDWEDRDSEPCRMDTRRHRGTG